MAPNGHKASGRRSARQSDIFSMPEWLKSHGKDEYQRWRREHPAQKLSYDDWKADEQHLHGLALFYATKNLLDVETSDDEAEPAEVKSRPRVVRTSSAREPKKKATTNGNGLPRATSSAASSPLPNSGESNSSGKRKRKARKKYLSEEIIASDGNSEEEMEETEELDSPAPTSEAALPTVPVIAVNGRSKSSSRRPRKKPISEETISPEDEIDDPMAIDAIATPPIASPLPVRSAPKSVVTAPSSASPLKKTHILKLSTRRVPNQTGLSLEAVQNGAENAGTPTKIAASAVTVIAEPNINNKAEDITATETSADHDAKSGTGSPDQMAASTRRGLRTRKPAQQRPYYHDAQLFDEAEPGSNVADDSPYLSQDVRSRRVSLASVSKGVDDELLEALDEETKALLQEDLSPDASERRPKHFKGKGRAWKKEESDEDEEYTLAKKRAAKAAKAAKAKVVEHKKRGRPRKSVPSENVVQGQSDADVVGKTNGSPKSPAASRSGSKEAPKRKRAPPRKSALSAEFVQDSSDDDEEQEKEQTPTANVESAEISTPPSKKKKAQAQDFDHSIVTTPIDSKTPKESPITLEPPKETKKITLSISLAQKPEVNEGEGNTNGTAPPEDDALTIASLD